MGVAPWFRFKTGPFNIIRVRLSTSLKRSNGLFCSEITRFPVIEHLTRTKRPGLGGGGRTINFVSIVTFDSIVQDSLVSRGRSRKIP